MFIFNLILLLALLAFIGSGLRDGLIHALGRIVGLVIGFLVAKAFYADLAAGISPFLSGGWGQLISFLFLFIVTVRVIGFIVRSLDKTYDFLAKLPFMKSINHALGGVLGFLEGMMILGGGLWLVKTFVLIPSLVAYANKSILATWIYNGFIKLLGILV